MGRIKISHNPGLTKESLVELLNTNLADKGYEIGLSKLIGADIYIKKTAWVGAVVKIRQKSDETILITRGYSPSTVVRFLFHGLIVILVLNPKWNKLIAEIEEIFKKMN